VTHVHEALYSLYIYIYIFWGFYKVYFCKLVDPKEDKKSIIVLLVVIGLYVYFLVECTMFSTMIF